MERPIAIVAIYNEVDIIQEAIHDLLDQECDVVAMDNWSTDGTCTMLEKLADLHFGRIRFERYPLSGPTNEFDLHGQLQRKEEIAAQFVGRWIIHSDADELRRAPLPGLTLAEGLRAAGRWGANRVNFRVLNFRPTAGYEHDGLSVERSMPFYELPDLTINPGYATQYKAWLQGSQRVKLAFNAGHKAEFDGALDYPVPFVIKHYPIRSAEHGRRKTLKERNPRYSKVERETFGWHGQYDSFGPNSSFLWDPAKLLKWDMKDY